MGLLSQPGISPWLKVGDGYNITLMADLSPADMLQVWWWCAILFGVSLVAFVFTYEETKFNHVSTLSALPEKIEGEIVQAQAPDKAISKEEKAVNATDIEVGSQECLRRLSVININPEIPRKTYRKKMAVLTTTHGSFRQFAVHSYQPFSMLFTLPAVGYMSLVYGVVITWSVVMTVTLSSVMLEPPWNFNAAQIGLMSLPPLIGTTLGNLLSGPISDWHILYLSKRNNGIFEPEMRLWVALPFIVFLPLGGFVFGYGLNNGWSWPVIAVASAISNFGAAPIQAIAITYVTDSYTEVRSRMFVEFRRLNVDFTIRIC